MCLTSFWLVDECLSIHVFIDAIYEKICTPNKLFVIKINMV